MQHIAIIGGTSSSFEFDFGAEQNASTPFGEARYKQAKTDSGLTVTLIERHRKGQAILSNQINHRANIAALKDLGAQAIISTSSCGVIDPNAKLATPFIFDDMYFSDNRLPSGECCSFYNTAGQDGRGHVIADSYFSKTLREVLIGAARNSGFEPYTSGAYAYALGPRFNTKAEIRAFASLGCVAVSQTAAPEAVLAAELEIPYALVGFGSDYANGVSEVPTPIEVLNENLGKAKTCFNDIAHAAIEILKDQEPITDTAFVYRFFN